MARLVQVDELQDVRRGQVGLLKRAQPAWKIVSCRDVTKTFAESPWISHLAEGVVPRNTLVVEPASNFQSARRVTEFVPMRILLAQPSEKCYSGIIWSHSGSVQTPVEVGLAMRPAEVLDFDIYPASGIHILWNEADALQILRDY